MWDRKLHPAQKHYLKQITSNIRFLKRIRGKLGHRIRDTATSCGDAGRESGPVVWRCNEEERKETKTKTPRPEVGRGKEKTKSNQGTKSREEGRRNGSTY